MPHAILECWHPNVVLFILKKDLFLSSRFMICKRLWAEKKQYINVRVVTEFVRLLTEFFIISIHCNNVVLLGAGGIWGIYKNQGLQSCFFSQNYHSSMYYGREANA